MEGGRARREGGKGRKMKGREDERREKMVEGVKGVIPNVCFIGTGVKWVTVSPDYLERAFAPAERLAWISFLEKIGVKKGIVIEQVVEKVPKVQNVFVHVRGGGGGGGGECIMLSHQGELLASWYSIFLNIYLCL